MQFGDADVECLAGHFDDFLDTVLEAVGVAFFAGKGAKLAAQDAVVGIVDVAIDNVAGIVAVLPLPNEIGDRADGIEVFAFKQAQAVGFGNTFTGDNFLVDVAQFAAFEKKAHRNLNPP